MQPETNPELCTYTYTSDTQLGLLFRALIIFYLFQLKFTPVVD